MSFISETLSEKIRTGKGRKPDYKNPVTIAKHKLQKRIFEQSESSDRPIEDISLDYVKANLPDLKRYVASRGEQPLVNPVELSVQVAALREKEISDVMNAIGCSRQDAETFIDESEAERIKINSPEADNFIGTIISAIGNVANKGIEKIAANRKAKGKPTKFWDFLSKNTKPKTDSGQTYGTDQPKFGEGIKIFAKDVLNDIRDNERNKEIKKALPLIIGGLAAVILITVLITSRAAKSK